MPTTNLQSTARKPRLRPDATTWRPVAFLVLLAVGGAGVALARGLVEAACFLGAALLARLLVPATRALAVGGGAIARSGGRSIHVGGIPRLGGLPLFVPVALWLGWRALGGEVLALGLLGGAMLVCALGVLDDLRGVRPRTKIAVQVAAGALLCLAGARLPALGLPGLGVIPLGNLEVPLILFWVVLAANAFNLADGLDGLAVSLGLLACGALVLLGVGGAVPVVLAGALAGLLTTNLPPATLFLGDSGSLLIGFLLAGLVLDLPAETNLPLVAGILAYPLGDVGLAVLRRFLRGKPLFAGDQSHVHHKLLAHLGSPARALVAALLFAALQAALALAWPGPLSLALQGLLWGGLAFLLLRAGGERLGTMLGTRKPFRRVHLVRAYVEGLLDMADSEEEVEDCLRTVVHRLDLTSIALGPIHIPADEHAALGATDVVVPLCDGVAQWSHAPNGDAEALVSEKRTVVCDILRRAEQRLRLLATRTGEAGLEASHAGNGSPGGGP